MNRVGKGNIKIHKEHGFIIGGCAEKRLKARLDREDGSNIYMDWLIRNKAIERKPYYIKLLFIPKEERRQWWGIGCHNELGVYALRDMCFAIQELGLLDTWIHIRTWNSKNKQNLNMYGTLGKGMAGWEKEALKDNKLVKELSVERS